LTLRRLLYTIQNQNASIKSVIVGYFLLTSHIFGVIIEKLHVELGGGDNGTPNPAY
jgi:hypothetical protein